jgi:multicomponent Na+:H+ antiporter subunit E
MSTFAKNMVLALVWAALTGDFSSSGLVLGFVIGFVALALVKPLLGVEDGRYFRRVYCGARLFFYFYYELFMSSFQVAAAVLAPRPKCTPGIVIMPLDVKGDFEILLVTNLISLTPGTLSLDVMPDRSAVLIHAMFADDPDEVVRSLKNGMERMVKEAFE